MFCTSYKPEIVLPVLQIKTKRFHVSNLYKTRKSTNNQFSNFDQFEEAMDLSSDSFKTMYLLLTLEMQALKI